MLPFIPRKVAKSLAQKNHATSSLGRAAGVPTTSTTPHVTELPPPSQNKSDSKGKEKAQEPTTLLEEDYAAMLSLSVSDYALWADPELRQNMDFAEDGFVPLAYLLDRIPLLDGTKSHALEAVLVKAIRSFASEVFDVRMLMSSPSRALWYGGTTHKGYSGGYEVRLRGWKDVVARAGGMTRNKWEEQTIYIENIPPQNRDSAGIHRFVSSLLSEVQSAECIHRIQHISLPRHHQDKPTDQPKCKGFALVTLAHSQDASFLLRQWPWQRHLTESSDVSESSTAHQSAVRFGFRATTKAHWDELNTEYLAYRQKLLEQLVVTDKA
ncbi:hypothetical protein PHLGIDRAFT_50327, partial [Phlebiopsis gigantea 11061_1 CR5-6]